MPRTDITFTVDGDAVAAWHVPASSDALTGPAGRPCVVIAHGLGATKTCGLAGFADRFAAAGADALVFDYRGFGASGGSPRQIVDPAKQRADYAGAIAYARGLDGVDPERIAVWGSSFAGGNVLAVGASDPRLAAVIALTPAADGAVLMLDSVRKSGPVASAKITALAIRDALGAARGREPVLAPLVDADGGVAIITSPGAAATYTELAGPDWVNGIAARLLLGLGLHRPVTKAKGIACPVLVQVADDDTVVPPSSCVTAGRKADATIEHYPGDHFDVYDGRPQFEAIVADQVAFLQRVLAPSGEAVAA